MLCNTQYNYIETIETIGNIKIMDIKDKFMVNFFEDFMI